MDNNNSIISKNSESKEIEQIALSFFPLETQEFTFTVFRKKYLVGEKVETFPNCFRRRLPIDPGSKDFLDYWVANQELVGFEKITLKPNDNIYLTKDIIYNALIENCRHFLVSEKDYIVRETTKRKAIFFCLEDYPEGKQVVWLEPYYLKTDKIFGFLADFKFLSPGGTKSTRHVQELSLSLDKDGRSNKNYYLDKFEQLEKFLIKFYEKIFPISIDSNKLLMEKKLFNIGIERLNSKQYVFQNNKLSNSQYNGIKFNGPLSRIDDNPMVFFLYRRMDKPFADDLFKALRGDTYGATFPGMEKMFNFKFNKDNVGGSEIEGYDVESLEDTIESIKKNANGRRIIPLLIIPFNKDGEIETKRTYYLAKYIFLKKKIPSQFVSLIQLRHKDQFKWSVSNIGLALFAKMGGKPWKVNSNSKSSLIIGIGQAHRIVNGRIAKYYAYSVLTESTGIYKELKILGKGINKESYLDDFKANLIQIFDKYSFVYDSFIIHSTFSIKHEELDLIESILDSYTKNPNNSKKFIVMKFNDKNKYFGYSLTSNSMIPYESSYTKLSTNEYLVWFEGLQYHNPNVIKKIERPLHVDFIYPKGGLTEGEKNKYLQDALNISGANWRGFNAKSLPVSIFYAYLVAEFYKEFQSLDLDDIDLETINPWFL